MKKKHYIIPTIAVYKMKTTLLAGSEKMNVDSDHQVTNDDDVFSRQGDFWGEEE